MHQAWYGRSSSIIIIRKTRFLLPRGEATFTWEGKINKCSKRGEHPRALTSWKPKIINTCNRKIESKPAFFFVNATKRWPVVEEDHVSSTWEWKTKLGKVVVMSLATLKTGHWNHKWVVGRYYSAELIEQIVQRKEKSKK